jgi:hypothetical protein
MYKRRSDIEPAGLSRTQCQQPDFDWVLTNLVAPILVSVGTTLILKGLFKPKRR